ncbi:MAG TPA: GatB/YqeY domain-containing protein [Anaerolineales bacterium]|nr:GatB/YqeY domain-containing protein [Anaerolineales bacterium]
MVTKSELEAELHNAMRSGDEVRKRTLRMILSSVKLAEVERRGELDEATMRAVLQREVKTRQETIADAEKARRPDLALAAQDELEIVQAYLPAPLSAEELEQTVRQSIALTGAAGPQDMGKVMKDLMPRLQGRADGKTVNETVRRLLNPA